MEALAGRDQSQTAPQMLTAPGARRIVGGGEVEAHPPEQGVQEPFGLAQREMGEEPQGQGGLDGEIRVPLPGHPHRHIAAANEGPVVGRPVRHAIFRLVRGMDLQLHPCSVAPEEGHEKCRPNRPTPPQGLHATTPSMTATRSSGRPCATRSPRPMSPPSDAPPARRTCTPIRSASCAPSRNPASSAWS